MRSVSQADLAEILEHNNQAVPAVNELAMVDLEAFVEMAHSFLVIDAPDGSIAGFMIGLTGPGMPYDSMNYAWFSARYESFIYVDRIVVAESGRGLGVGSQLYAAFADRGVADGFDVMLAEVNIRPRNDVSLAFHDARGFVSVGKQDTDGGAKRVTMLERSLVRPTPAIGG
jgi:predicted GNAT superfamily acetyltransferase